jgi:predicted O-linked N-acetylglucosamine transferase (SPINDLY family)
MAGRQGEALLKQIGRSVWVASSQQEYLSVAAELAQDPDELTVIRHTQRSIIQASELCNEEAFAADFLSCVQRACFKD